MVKRIRETCSLVMLAALLPAGCLQAALDEWNALTAAEPSTGAGTTADSSGTADVEPTSGVQTVTSATTAPSFTTAPSPADTTSSTGEPAEPLEIKQFKFEPSPLTKPGLSSAVMEVGDNVTSATIYLDDKIVAQGPPDTLTYALEATSADFNGDYDFKLRVFDGNGGSKEQPATLKVDIQPHGTIKCPFQDEESEHSGIASLVFGEKYIAALGTRDEGSGPKLSLWRIDPMMCGQYDQRSIDDWTKLDVKKWPSTGAALAIDESGNYVIAGNLLVGADPQPYLALLRADDLSLIWETTGDLGDEATGVTRVPWPYEHIVMVGSRRTSENPSRYDGLVKGYTTTGVVWVDDKLRAPFTADEAFKDKFNQLSEKAFAVEINPDTLEVLVVGEREFQLSQQIKDIRQRTFTARYSPLGGRLGTWTSTGDYLPHDSARSLRWCSDAFIAGGWTRDIGVDAKSQPLVRRLDDEGKSLSRRAEPFGEVTIRGVDCDREGKVVSAGERVHDGQSDALIFATKLPEHPPVWQDEHYGLGNGDDGAMAVDCDTWGFCAWGGYEYVDGKTRAIVKIHYP